MSQENTLRATLTPSGFHRTISVTIPHLTADHDDCTCHIYLALPAAMFVDPYELALYHEIFTFEYWGTRDLERPVAAVSQADSLVLIKSQLGKLDGIPQQIERHFNTSNGFILTSLPPPLNTCNRPASPLVMNIPLGDPSHTFLVEVAPPSSYCYASRMLHGGRVNAGADLWGARIEGHLGDDKEGGIEQIMWWLKLGTTRKPFTIWPPPRATSAIWLPPLA
ncbi:hypothetical protein BD779DRAFT_1478292 [Infundibulicybe gibba]|nr:hypothetical protein BD779DRAFT_1478292 [Infundibulicybe gibba]